jgi:hypothetical protein
MEKEMVKRNDLKWEFVVPIVTWATYEKNELIFVEVKFHSNENIEMALHTT